MSHCTRCNAVIPNRLFIDGKQRVLSTRRYCISCKPFGKKGRVPQEGKEDIRHCLTCKKPYIYNKSKGSTLTRCGSCLVNANRVNRKEFLVKHLGGKCVLCGYDKCVKALHFHHIEPSSKKFTVSGNHCRNMVDLLKEVEKCCLLCANCHTEVEAGFTSLACIGTI